MASGPDLFVVCKSCGSEVSPYVTECPYCGTRVRKRAPKLDSGGPPKGRRGPTVPSLGKLRSGEIPGIRGDEAGRPYATLALVVVAGLLSAGVSAGIGPLVTFFVDVTRSGDTIARTLASSFVYLETGYEAAALVSIGLFGWLLERHYGRLAPLLVFVGATVAGGFALAASPGVPLVMGGNAAALGMLAAWAVPQLAAWRRKEESETDGYGALAFAVVLLALPLATSYASPLAGAAGLVAGGLLGVALLPLARR